MTTYLIFIAGVLFGAVVVFIIVTVSKRKAADEVKSLREEMEKSFKALSMDALSQSTDQLVKVSREILGAKASESSSELESKKRLIDQSLTSLTKEMQERLERVQKLMTEINQNVPAKYGQVSSALQDVARQSENLRQTTESLRIALAGTQRRGQWGERMAEDILRLVGMVEGINYEKQQQVESGRSRPDFTFFLPGGLKVNMDVKFPLDKYLEYLEADDDNQQEKTKKIFLNSVRGMIKDVASRDYINPDDNTVDYVLVFIPNEQVYAFIHENDSAILDDALKQKVVLCSPLTLYAVLALMRQAIDNFNLKRSSKEIQALLGGFLVQWGKFLESMSKVGQRLEQTREEYERMVGTRRRMLDRQIRKIDQLNKAEGIEPRLLSETDEPQEIDDDDDNKKDDLLM